MSNYYPVSSMYGIKNMKIKKLIIQETGTYNQQWKRPFNSGLDGQTFNTIMENVQSARAIKPTALTGVANQFIHPTAQPESHIVIPNGWNERRLRYFLEIQTESQIGAIQTEYVVGYTDHNGLSLGQHLDPQMRFFINAVNTTRSMVQNTPLGSQTIQNVIDSSHILANEHYAGILNPSQVFRLRPEDVFVQMDSMEIQQETSGDFTDTRLTIGREPIKSKRSNAIAPVFVSSILDSYLQTQRAEHNGGSRTELIESARHAIKSPSIATDPFMSFIRSRSDQSGNSFTYQDLLALDPNVQAVTVLLPMTPTIRSTLHEAGTTADWAASNGETLFATCVSQSVPGYMLDHCINKLHFQATNRSIGSQIQVQIVDVKSFMQGVDITPQVQAMIFKLETELLRDLSYNNQMDFMLDMRCDLLGETWINVSINGGALYTYVSPSFADALMSPVTTSNQQNLIAIANDFDTLLDQIGDSTNVYGGMPMAGFGNV